MLMPSKNLTSTGNASPPTPRKQGMVLTATTSSPWAIAVHQHGSAHKWIHGYSSASAHASVTLTIPPPLSWMIRKWISYKSNTLDQPGLLVSRYPVTSKTGYSPISPALYLSTTNCPRQSYCISRSSYTKNHSATRMQSWHLFFVVLNAPNSSRCACSPPRQYNPQSTSRRSMIQSWLCVAGPLPSKTSQTVFHREYRFQTPLVHRRMISVDTLCATPFTATSTPVPPEGPVPFWIFQTLCTITDFGRVSVED